MAMAAPAGNAAVGILDSSSPAAAVAFDARDQRICALASVRDFRREVVLKILERYSATGCNRALEFSGCLSQWGSHVKQVGAATLDSYLLELDQRVSSHRAAHPDHHTAARRHPLLFGDAVVAPHLPASRKPLQLVERPILRSLFE
jgi:5,10-methylenetetrahydrofolate reductase